MSRMKLAAAAMVLALLPGFSTAAQDKVGVVDIQKVLDTIEEGKEAKSKFETEMRKKKEELDKKQAEMRKMEQDFEKQKMVLAADALEKKKVEMNEKRAEVQQFVLGANQEMQKREMELSGSILKKIRDVVERIGRDDGYDFIWEKNEGGIVYFKSAFDLTDRVIKSYDQTNKKK